MFKPQTIKVIVAHKQHITAAKHPAIAIVEGIDGRIVLVVAAQRDETQDAVARNGQVLMRPLIVMPAVVGDGIWWRTRCVVKLGSSFRARSG